MLFFLTGDPITFCSVRKGNFGNKVFLIGDGGEGKASVVRWIKGDKFEEKT